MKVFISWSGELSRNLAEALREWLPRTLQSVKPYFTPDDIEKGARWESEISKELAASDICIIALTRESLSSHWISFEAGAISRTIGKAKVIPILFGIESRRKVPSPDEGDAVALTFARPVAPSNFHRKLVYPPSGVA